MSSTNKTPNYALPQFIPTDKPTWLGDVNAAMIAIDTAMADNHTTAESANTSASAAVAQVQHAVDTANEAKVDSAAALQNATNAIGVAQNALNSATQATQTAQAATQTANAANNSAASAVATANQAKQTAEHTQADLTEFKHAFTVAIPNHITNYSGTGIRVSPAFLALIAPSTIGQITSTETIVWKVKGAALAVNNDFSFDVENNMILVAHAPSGGYQEIGLKTKDGTYNIINQHVFLYYYSTEDYEALVNANSGARAIMQEDGPCLIGVFKS